MSDPVLGVVVERVDEEPRPQQRADMSTILIAGPSSDADPVTFPLNTPVRVFSNDITKTKKLGKSYFLADAIRGINDQLGQAQFAAQVIVIRTPHATTGDAAAMLRTHIIGIVGDSTAGTGLWAGLLAPEMLGATPRLWMAPGFTAALANSVDTITADNRGTGYVPGTVYPLTFSGGGTGAVQATAQVTALDDGTLGDAVILTAGGYYTEEPTVTVAAPGGSGTQAVFSATIDQLSNPVVAALPGVLAPYLAHAIVESAGTSLQSDIDYRETIGSDRIIVLSGGVKVTNLDTGTPIVRPFAPRFTGALVRVDHESGSCFRSACNQPIFGVLGPARSIRYNLSALENEGQQLLAANVGFLARGDVGNDFSISNGGFVALVLDNAGSDPLWKFYNQVRGRDFIHLTMIRTLRYYLGKFNVTAHSINAAAQTMKNILRDEKAKDNIIGYKVAFNANDNSPEGLRAGIVGISFAAEEPAPFTLIKIKSSRYRPALDAEIAQLASQLNMAA